MKKNVFIQIAISLFFLLLISCSKDENLSLDTSSINLDFTKFKGTKMLIVTVPKFENELNEFIQYKESLGFEVELDLSSALIGANEIKEKIYQKYMHEGLNFVILVGDIEYVPSLMFEGQPSDPSYVLLEGDDLINEALLSRISVKETYELKNIINKLLFYQKGLFQNKAWISKAIVAGTHEFDGINHTMGIAQEMRERSDYFDCIVEIHENDADPSGVLINSIETIGANLIVMNSHGSYEGFYSIRFKNDDIRNLNGYGGSFPYIHGAACSTGEFQNSAGDCFAEVVMKTGTYENPEGAIGMSGFSCSTDPDPAMALQRVAFKELYFEEEIVTLGELLSFACIRVQGQFSDIQYERLYKHWHLFGDCSMPLWKKAP